MIEADREADMVHKTSHIHHPAFAIIFILLVSMGIFSWFEVDKPREIARQQRQQQVVQQQQQQQQPTAAVVQQPATVQMVNATLDKVEADLKRGVDVNNDGKINCIDAAVLFYKYYPNKQNCYITLNQHGDMNHLFNTVLVDNTWRCIEPQAHYKYRYETFYIRDIWGSTYDSNYNEDATQQYKKFVK